MRMVTADPGLAGSGDGGWSLQMEIEDASL
jgi:hypothetical protein